MEPFHGPMDWESWDASSPQQIQAREGTMPKGSVRDLWDFGTAAGLGGWSTILPGTGEQRRVPRACNEMKTPFRKHLESPQTITSLA